MNNDKVTWIMGGITSIGHFILIGGEVILAFIVGAAGAAGSYAFKRYMKWREDRK